MNTQAVATVDEAEALPVSVTPKTILEIAITQGASVEIIRELMALQREADADRGRKAFDEALSEAKGEIPTITKNRVVDFTSQKGRTNYRHEDFAEIARTVDPVLKRHGLSYRFRVTSEVNQPVAVTCILAHRDGHSESTTLHAGRDDSGNKNSIQAIGSTITYLQRYTLKAALGLAASNDDDAKTSEDVAGPISADDLKHLRATIEKVGANEPVFCKYMGVERLEDLLASDYTRAVAALGKKQKAAQA